MRKITVDQVGSLISLFIEQRAGDDSDTRNLTKEEADHIAMQIGFILQDMDMERVETERVRDL